jgi:hypothetical protein
MIAIGDAVDRPSGMRGREPQRVQDRRSHSRVIRRQRSAWLPGGGTCGESADELPRIAAPPRRFDPAPKRRHAVEQSIVGLTARERSIADVGARGLRRAAPELAADVLRPGSIRVCRAVARSTLRPPVVRLPSSAPKLTQAVNLDSC